MKIAGIIPARYASTRFPGKALALIQGKTMIQRVYEQASKAASLYKVLVATDDASIFDHVKEFGGEAVITSVHHQSGTDRCAEALEKTGELFDFIINIQGDEPTIQPEQINLLAASLKETTQIATLVKKITDTETLFNPNTPKVIFNKDQEAVYFSRHPLPYVRGAEEKEWLQKFNFYKHIGIYAYRADILKEITMIPPSPLELAESLEQLRWLENGYRITVAETEMDSVGVDTEEDLKKLKVKNEK